MKGFAASIGLTVAYCVSAAAIGSAAPVEPPPDGCTAVTHSVRATASAAPTARSFPPPQLEIRVPFAPAPVRSHGRSYLFYELHLQNYSEAAFALRGIDVLNADDEMIAHLDAKELAARVMPIGVERLESEALGAGQSALVFLCLQFDDAVRMPGTLQHRLMVNADSVSGGAVRVGGTKLPVLAAPLTGASWTAADSPSLASHHRTGVFVVDGLAQISRRYAVDWKILSDGASFKGDALDVRAYYAYGKRVRAVADGTVVSAKDGLPDNVPRTAAGFTPAVDISADTVAGNTVVLRLNEGQFAHYAHLQPGSVRVKPGDRVKRGAELGRVGNSGDAREPHLHFQLSSSSDILAGEGLPYSIDAFRARTADGEWTARRSELPLGPVVVDFGEQR